MSEYGSQIAEKIKQMQEQNDARAAEIAEAEKAMAKGEYKSEPKAEQVKPNPNKKKKKKKKTTVTVQSDIAKAIESAKQEAEISPVKAEDGKTEQEPKKEQKPAERAEKSSLSKAFESYEKALGENSEKKAPKDTLSVPKKDIEESIDTSLKEASSTGQTEESAKTEDNLNEEKPAKKEKPKHKGPHATVYRKTRYVDTSGTELKSFCLIEESTGEVRRLKDETIIGKSERADITIANRYVSRQHAKITREDGEWYIEDLNSTNGTKVNGTEINEKTRIEIGDNIELARHALLFDVVG